MVKMKKEIKRQEKRKKKEMVKKLVLWKYSFYHLYIKGCKRTKNNEMTHGLVTLNRTYEAYSSTNEGK